MVGEAETAIEASAKIAALAPDVVLVDSDIARISVSGITQALEERGYSGPVVVISGSTGRLTDALEAGAAGYLLKDSPFEEVVGVLLSAKSGGFAFGATVMEDPDGMKIALQYIAGQPTNQRRSGASRSDPEVVAEGHRSEQEPSSSTEAVASIVEIVISGQTNLRSVLRLHDFLRETANVELNQTAGSRGGDTMFTAIFDRLVNPVSLLSGLPDVESVSEEPSTGPIDDDPGRIRRLSELPEFTSSTAIVKRYRLVLRET